MQLLVELQLKRIKSLKLYAVHEQLLVEFQLKRIYALKLYAMQYAIWYDAAFNNNAGQHCQ